MLIQTGVCAVVSLSESELCSSSSSSRTEGKIFQPNQLKNTFNLYEGWMSLEQIPGICW